METVSGARGSDFLSSILPTEQHPPGEHRQEKDDGWLFTRASNDALHSPDESVMTPLPCSEGRDGVRTELSCFLERLHDLQFDGEPLVQFPADYDGLIERLIVDNRTGNTCLKDWNGPRRFEELPIAQLREGLDKETTEGLRTIDLLDTVLRDRTIEAYIVERETFPERARLNEQTRRERKQHALDKAFKREQEHIQRLSQLRRAMDFDLHEQERPLSNRSRHSERQAQIVDRLMALSEEELSENPFDCDVCLPNLEDLPPFLSETASLTWDIASQSVPKGGCSSKQTSLYQSLRPDYLQQQRQEKELQQRLNQIDQDLQRLKTSDPFDSPVSADSMVQLIMETRSELLNNAIEVVDFTESNVREILKSNFI